MPSTTRPNNLGPDGEDVEIEPQHLAAARSAVAMGHDDPPLEDRVAQAIANAEARGARAGYDDGHTDGAHDGTLPGNEPDGVAFVVREDERRHLEQLFFRMPYGAGLRGAPSRSTLTAEHIDAARLLTMLEHLAERLAEAGESHSAMEAKYHALLADRAALRRYLAPARLALLQTEADDWIRQGTRQVLDTWQSRLPAEDFDLMTKAVAAYVQQVVANLQLDESED